jgi:glycosyltransferase involved in cell wall biosynthesis
MRKIFISIPWFSPAFKAGGPIQSISNMVNALDSGYEFFIYTSNEDLHGLPTAVTITDEWVDYNAYTKVWYSRKHDRSQHLVEQVEAIKPDVLYIVGVFSWHYNIVPLLYAKATRKILSVRGMLHPGALAQKAWKKKIFIQLLRWLKVDRNIEFHVTDETEAGYVRQVLGEGKGIHVASNFLNMLPQQKPPEKAAGQLKLVSIGIISPMKNYLKVLTALQDVKQEINYTIYGPVKEAAYWEQCLAMIKTLPPNISVQYEKELPPHKIAAKLAGQHVFVLPSESENFGHAIAEALSVGLPVISSENVPWKGLEAAKAGRNIDSDAALRDAIVFFAEMGQEEYSAYSEGAARYIRDRVDEEGLKRGYGFFG